MKELSLGLDYFKIAMNSTSTIRELEKLMKGEEYNKNIITFGYEIVEGCRKVLVPYSNPILTFKDLYDWGIYHPLVLNDLRELSWKKLRGDEILKGRMKKVEKVHATLEVILEIEKQNINIVSKEMVGQSINFFKELVEKCREYYFIGQI